MVRTFYVAGVALLVLAFSAVPGWAQAEEEGKPDQVWKVKIEGAQSFSSIVLKEQIATDGFSFWEELKFWDRRGHRLIETEVRKDVIRLRNYYNRRGFPNASVSYRIAQGNKDWKKVVIFTVSELAPITISNISFAFPGGEKYRDMIMESSDFKRAQRKSDFKEGRRYETIKLPEIEGAYQQVIKNQGFAYAEVTVKAKVDTARLSAEVTIENDTGPLTYLSAIDVSGDSVTSDGYIIRESNLKIGDRYSLDALEEAQREIFNHHMFRFATISINEQPHDSTLELDLRVRERELRTVNTSIGFGTQDYVRGRLSWTHRNAFGRVHRFTTTARASFIEQSLNLNYLFPYLFNTKSSFVISPFAEHLLEPSYELTRAGITNSVIYRYSQNLTGTLSYQFTRNAEISQQDVESLPDTTQNYNLSSIQLGGYYNEGFGRRGQRGWVVQPFVEISGFLGTSTFQFQKLSADVRRYTPLTESTTLATRVQVGRLFAASEDSLPNNVRFYLGGTNSVRGWGRDQLGPQRAITTSPTNQNGEAIPDSSVFSRYVPAGGRTFVGFNFEIRQSLESFINNIGIAAFLDGGQVWRKVLDAGRRPLQFSLGGGLRYSSPIGPVRFDVGYKLNPTDADLNIFNGQDFGGRWDRYGFHLSIGQSF